MSAKPHQLLPALILPFLALAAAPAQTTGISRPDQDTIQADHYVEPSRAATTQTAAPTAAVYQNSFPATGTEPAPAEPTLLPRNTPAAPASIAYAAPTPPPATDPDGEIVLAIPTTPHELNSGTLLHARLRETLSTRTTPEGAVFTAELLADVGHGGEVMLPAGSLLRGHVASLHGGRRVTGGASIYLRPETVSLPDGTLYRLDAQVTGIDSKQDLRVNDEGNVQLHSNPKAAAAVIGGVTATAAVTGAVVGGGVGAAVGAIAGAGVGTAVYLKREVQETLPAGTDLIFALNQPLTITPH